MWAMIMTKVINMLDKIATVGALNGRQDARVSEKEILEGRVFLGGGMSGVQMGWEEVASGVSGKLKNMRVGSGRGGI